MVRLYVKIQILFHQPVLYYQQLLHQSPGHSAEGITRRVVKGAEEFRQTMPQQDDVTVLSLYRPLAEAPAAPVGSDTILS